MRVRALIVPPKLDELGQVRILPVRVDEGLRVLQRLLHLGVVRLHHQVLVNGLVEQRIGLIVHGVHRVMHDVVERQEWRAAQLLRDVALRVLLHMGGHGLPHGGQLGVEFLERRGATMVSTEAGKAARAAELPELRLFVAQCLPEGHMRAVAEILEARAPVVRVLALAEVVECGAVSFVAALAEGGAEGVRVVGQ